MCHTSDLKGLHPNLAEDWISSRILDFELEAETGDLGCLSCEGVCFIYLRRRMHMNIWWPESRLWQKLQAVHQNPLLFLDTQLDTQSINFAVKCSQLMTAPQWKVSSSAVCHFGAKTFRKDVSLFHVLSAFSVGMTKICLTNGRAPDEKSVCPSVIVWTVSWARNNSLLYWNHPTFGVYLFP